MLLPRVGKSVNVSGPTLLWKGCWWCRRVLRELHSRATICTFGTRTLDSFDWSPKILHSVLFLSLPRAFVSNTARLVDSTSTAYFPIWMHGPVHKPHVKLAVWHAFTFMGRRCSPQFFIAAEPGMWLTCLKFSSYLQKHSTCNNLQSGLNVSKFLQQCLRTRFHCKRLGR